MTYHEKLQKIIDSYVDSVYEATKSFPKDELYGVTSQLRRASLSVALNYVEGYARQRSAVTKNFLEISYGSLKESQYLLSFSLRQRYMAAKEYERIIATGDEIGRMMWAVIKGSPGKIS